MRPVADSDRAEATSSENPSYRRLKAAIKEIDEARKEIGALLSEKNSKKESHLPLARRLLSERKMRGAIFPENIFGEPAWDIILDLYIARSEGKITSVSSVCVGLGAPPTTVLRWIRALEELGIVERIEDQRDSRRVYIKLSDAGFLMLNDYLEKIDSL